MKSVIVLGLGRFGSALAKKLYEKDVEVMAVDRDYTIVQRISDQVSYAVQADITDEKALRNLGISNFDIAVIATAGNLESSIEATLICKDEGIKTVIAKSRTESHARILEKIGADKVIFPELETGERLARFISGSNLLEFVQFSSNFSLAEVRIQKSWVGKSLKELDIRNKYKVNVLAFERAGDTIMNPNPNEKIKENDLLLVFGEAGYVRKLEEGEGK